MVCCADSSMLLFEIAENWVFKWSLQIYVLQIMQNNTSHPKSLIINYIIIWIPFEGFHCCSKHALMWRVFRHNLLMVSFLCMFCKLVFSKLQNMGWPSNVTWNIYQRRTVKMAKATYIYGIHCHNVIKNTTSQK